MAFSEEWGESPIEIWFHNYSEFSVEPHTPIYLILHQGSRSGMVLLLWIFFRSTSWWEWLNVAVAHFVVHHTGSYGWGSALTAYVNATFLSIACQMPQRHTSFALLGDGAALPASSLSQCFIKQTRFCQPRFPYFSPSQMFPWLWQRSRQIAGYDLCWKWIRWRGRGGGEQMVMMRKSDSW